MVEVGRELWTSSGPTFLLKQGHPDPVAQDHIRRAFGYVQGQRLHNLPGQPVLLCGHPDSEKAFPDVQREPAVFQCVPVASGPVTGHHCKESGSIFTPSVHLFVHIDEITTTSLLFSRLSSPSSLSLSSHERCSRILNTVGPRIDSWGTLLVASN